MVTGARDHPDPGAVFPGTFPILDSSDLNTAPLPQPSLSIDVFIPHRALLGSPLCSHVQSAHFSLTSLVLKPCWPPWAQGRRLIPIPQLPFSHDPQPSARQRTKQSSDLSALLQALVAGVFCFTPSRPCPPLFGSLIEAMSKQRGPVFASTGLSESLRVLNISSVLCLMARSGMRARLPVKRQGSSLYSLRMHSHWFDSLGQGFIPMLLLVHRYVLVRHYSVHCSVCIIKMVMSSVRVNFKRGRPAGCVGGVDETTAKQMRI